MALAGGKLLCCAGLVGLIGLIGEPFGLLVNSGVRFLLELELEGADLLTLWSSCSCPLRKYR